MNTRADWLAARAMIASRRLRPFRWAAMAVFGVVFLAVYAVRGPLAERAAATQRATDRAKAAERDTIPLLARLRAANDALADRDSMLRAARTHSANAAAELSAEKRHERDSLRALGSQLAAALDRAAKAPLPASYRALAETRSLRQLGAVQVIMDTLDLLENARRSLDPVAAPQSEFAQLSRRANALGSDLQAIGQARLAVLARQLAAIEAPGTGLPAALEADIARAQSLRDSARLNVTSAESLLRATREWQASLHARADSLAYARAARILGASPAVAAASFVLMALVLGFTLAVLAEVRTPTIAHAREAERVSQAPVLGVAMNFHIPHEGRARLRPGSAVDESRMAYLALTASGARGRVVCVTGVEPSYAVAVAGRLAVSAAADERATLLVDLSPGVPGSSGFFGWRDEPGFTDAIAGVRLWREVARPIGTSEGYSLEVIPAGGSRQDTEASVRDPAARDEFKMFLSEYDFAVLVALHPAAVEHAAALCDSPLTILTARVGRTRLETLKTMATHLRDAGASVHGILLVDEN